MAPKTKFKRVDGFQLFWNLDANVGGVRLWVDGVDEPVERELDTPSFIAMGLLLSSGVIDDTVIGKLLNGQSFAMAGTRSR